jgi:hypothetical protein
MTSYFGRTPGETSKGRSSCSGFEAFSHLAKNPGSFLSRVASPFAAAGVAHIDDAALSPSVTVTVLPVTVMRGGVDVRGIGKPLRVGATPPALSGIGTVRNPAAMSLRKSMPEPTLWEGAYITCGPTRRRHVKGTSDRRINFSPHLLPSPGEAICFTAIGTELTIIQPLPSLLPWGRSHHFRALPAQSQSLTSMPCGHRKSSSVLAWSRPATSQWLCKSVPEELDGR